jgi:hypothetical protein
MTVESLNIGKTPTPLPAAKEESEYDEVEYFEEVPKVEAEFEIVQGRPN